MSEALIPDDVSEWRERENVRVPIWNTEGTLVELFDDKKFRVITYAELPNGDRTTVRIQVLKDDEAVDKVRDCIASNDVNEALRALADEVKETIRG